MKEALLNELGAKIVSVILAFAVWYLIKSHDAPGEQLVPALHDIVPSN